MIGAGEWHNGKPVHADNRGGIWSAIICPHGPYTAHYHGAASSKWEAIKIAVRRWHDYERKAA